MTPLCVHCGREYAPGVQAACRDCRLAPEAGPTGPRVEDLGEQEVAFDLAEWRPEDRVALGVTLTERQVPWRWEVGPEVVVRATDETVVTRLMEEAGQRELVPETAELSEEDDGADDVAAQAAMSDLFDAADRLLHNGANVDALDEIDELRSVIAETSPPFGVEQSTWEDLRRLAAAVSGAADGDGGEDDEELEGAVEAAAQALRDYLRDFV